MTRGIQIDFAVPVEISPKLQEVIFRAVQDICKDNPKPGRAHWASGHGDLPLDLDFTEWDDTVWGIQTTERAMHDGEKL